MLYKTPRIASEFAGLHPDLKALLLNLDAWLFENGMERPTITDALRTPDQQEALYTQHYLDKRLPLPTAKRMARARFSWHLCACAADFRHTVNRYTDAERARIWEWLKARTTPDPKDKNALTWELLDHDIGHGKHFHVAVRDFVVRRQWEMEAKANAD